MKDTEFEVIKASSGKECIKIAKEHKPNIIFLDIMMPEFDGFMTCITIKQNPETKHIPVIFNSETNNEWSEYNYYAGAHDYIMKPFSPNDLLSRLRRMLIDL